MAGGDPQTTAGSDDDQDRRIDYAYTDGLLTSVTRQMPKTTTLHDNDQVTTYAYITGGGSQVASKNLLTTVTNPDSTTTSYTYNALSQVATTTDPAGNVITNGYDLGGRVTSRIVTTYSSGTYAFDTRVKEIDTSYESRGMVGVVKQKNSGGTVLDEIALVYDGWGNLASSTQDPDSAISGGSGRTSYDLTWTWARSNVSGGWRNMYLTQWTQPDGSTGMVCFPRYTVAGAEVDTPIRRPIRIEDDTTWVAEYSYMGVATVVGANQPETLMKSAFKLYESGSSGYGTYMDNFNRPIVNQWVRDRASGTDPKVLNLAVTYDIAGNVATMQDNVLLNAAGNHNFDAANTYDDLRRLKSRVEGVLSGAQSRIETYARNLAGRITSDQVSLDSNGNFDDGPLSAIQAGEMDDDRSYNDRNQLIGRDFYDKNNLVSGGVRASKTLLYDANGNMVDDGEKYLYKYNPWGQLVEIKNRLTPFDVQAEFHYNGLGQRIAEHLDTNRSLNDGYTDGVVDPTYDPWSYMAVDPKGRRMATFKASDTYPKETFVYHLTGPGATSAVSGRGASGPNFANGGGVLLRARDSALNDPTQWATTAASATRGERNYYCSDFRHNVSAMVDSGGGLVEQVRYSPSGVPYAIPYGDIDSNGSVDVTNEDTPIVNALWNTMTPVYQDRADLDLDGDVDATDEGLITTNWKESVGRGELSGWWVGNGYGHCGNDTFGNGFDSLSSSANENWINVGLGRSIHSTNSLSSSTTLSGDSVGSTCRDCGSGNSSPVSSVAVELVSQAPPFRENLDLLFAACFSIWGVSPPISVPAGPECSLWCHAQLGAQWTCLTNRNEEARKACGDNEECQAERRSAAGRAYALMDSMLLACVQNCMNNAPAPIPIDITPIEWPYPIDTPGYPDHRGTPPHQLPDYGIPGDWIRLEPKPRRGDFPPFYPPSLIPDERRPQPPLLVGIM